MSQHDTHSIRTDDLAPYIIEWIFVYNELNELGAGGINALAMRSGISQKTISEIILRRRNWVRLKTADALFTAMGKPHVMSILEPNPIEPDRPPSHYYEE